jgi:oligopeptide transport system substrate-binding protein
VKGFLLTLVFGMWLGAASATPTMLNQGLAIEPPSLDPQVAGGTIVQPLISDLFVGLVTRDAASNPVAGCAERWEASDDGLTWTFHLRDGLQWSDGAPLTARDFVYSFHRLLGGQAASPVAGMFFPIVNAREALARRVPVEQIGVIAPDDRTVVMQLRQPVPYLAGLLANVPVFPVPRHAIEKHGTEWTRAGNLVSNGPYMVVERVPQAYIRTVKNPRFYDAAAVGIEEVRWHPTPDPATALKRFRAGELDVIQTFPGEELQWVKANLPGSLHMVPLLGTYFLALNTKQAPLDDARVRQALSLAIDREALAEQVLRIGVKAAWSLITPQFEGYPAVTLPEQSLPLAERQQRARKLLAEGGFGSARPLALKYTYDSQEENRRVFVAVASMWQAIGVATEAVTMEFGALLQKVRAGDFQVARSGGFASYGDPYGLLQQLSRGHPANGARYENPRFDELIDSANGLADPAARMQRLAEAERMMLAEQPIIPLYYQVSRRLVSSRVQGWVDTPRGTPPSRYLSLAP